MTQKARPASDVSNSGWTPQIVFKQISEVVPDDTTLVSSSANPQGDSFEVRFPPMAWPQNGQGTLRVRLSKNGPDSVPAMISLKQGSTILASMTVFPGTSFAEQDLVLTQDILNQITDYTDLRLRVTAGYSVSISCCPTRKYPEVLHVAVTNKTGGAVCLPDSFLLVWDGFSRWITFITACRAADIELLCSVGGSSCNDLQLSSSFCGFLVYPDAGSSCDPLSLVYSNVPLSAVCAGTAGTATFTITE